MKRLTCVFSALLWGLLIGADATLWVGEAKAETLFDALALAYQTNPNLKAQRADLRATNEGYVQALGAYGPQVRVSGQYGYQDARVQQPAGLFTPAQTTEYKAGTGAANLSVVQPLYAGGSSQAALSGSQSNILAGREALREVENQLLQNVVIAYEDVRRDRECLRVLREEIAALTNVFAEIKAKHASGALSQTDLAQSQSRLLSAQAQALQIQGRLTLSNAEYVNVVGQNPGELAPPPDLPGLPGEVDQAFDAAEHNNPKLLRAMRTEDSARSKIAEAKAANKATLSLHVDAGINPTEPYLERQYDRSVSVSAVINKPLFTSGINSSKVREALEQDNRARFEIESNRRDVVQAVAQAWDQMQSSRNAAMILKQQVDAQTLAVKGNRIEERAGLRSTIELLNAELELTNTRISLVQSQRDEYVAKAQLLAAMGLMEMRLVSPGAETYDAKAALTRVRPELLETLSRPVQILDGLGQPAATAGRPLVGSDKSQRPEVMQTSPPVFTDPANAPAKADPTVMPTRRDAEPGSPP